MLKHLLAAKANLNLVGVEGDTPLSRAATQGHLKVLDSLISNGAICITQKKPGRAYLSCKNKYTKKSALHTRSRMLWGHR